MQNNNYTEYTYYYPPGPQDNNTPIWNQNEYWKSPDYPNNHPLNNFNPTKPNNELQVYYKKALKFIFKEVVSSLLPGGWLIKMVCSIFF
jgi:hypothetical protein